MKENQKQIHRNCYEVLINDMITLRDGGKSSNGVQKKTAHPEIQCEAFDQLIAHLEKLSVKAKSRVKGLNANKVFSLLMKLSEEDRNMFFDMYKNNSEPTDEMETADEVEPTDEMETADEVEPTDDLEIAAILDGMEL